MNSESQKLVESDRSLERSRMALYIVVLCVLLAIGLPGPLPPMEPVEIDDELPGAEAYQCCQCYYELDFSNTFGDVNWNAEKCATWWDRNNCDPGTMLGNIIPHSPASEHGPGQGLQAIACQNIDRARCEEDEEPLRAYASSLLTYPQQIGSDEINCEDETNECCACGYDAEDPVIDFEQDCYDWLNLRENWSCDFKASFPIPSGLDFSEDSSSDIFAALVESHIPDDYCDEIIYTHMAHGDTDEGEELAETLFKVCEQKRCSLTGNFEYSCANGRFVSEEFMQNMLPSYLIIHQLEITFQQCVTVASPDGTNDYADAICSYYLTPTSCKVEYTPCSEMEGNLCHFASSQDGEVFPPELRSAECSLERGGSTTIYCCEPDGDDIEQYPGTLYSGDGLWSLSGC